MTCWIRWEEMAWERVNDRISRKVVMSDRMMMVMYRFAPNLVWPEEIHEAEQGGYIIKGRLELNLPGEGEKILLGAGDGYLIASNIPHSWKTLEEGAIFIDIFSPPRKELLEKKFAPCATEQTGKSSWKCGDAEMQLVPEFADRKNPSAK